MEEQQEKMILEHEPVPGYRKPFYLVLAIGVIYLLIVFGRVLL